MLSNSVGEVGRASSNKQHEDLTFTTAEQIAFNERNRQVDIKCQICVYICILYRNDKSVHVFNVIYVVHKMFRSNFIFFFIFFFFSERNEHTD